MKNHLKEQMENWREQTPEGRGNTRRKCLESTTLFHDGINKPSRCFAEKVVFSNKLVVLNQN